MLCQALVGPKLWLSPCVFVAAVCMPLPQRTLHAPHLASPDLQQPGAPPPPGSLSGVAQLLLFLSGSPDIGVGKTVAVTAPGGAAGHAGAGGRVVGPGSGDISRQVRVCTGCVQATAAATQRVCLKLLGPVGVGLDSAVQCVEH